MTRGVISASIIRAAAAPTISKSFISFSMGSVAHGSLSLSGQTLAGVGQILRGLSNA
jgi:hypothetical protein